ncbi:MAG: flagellar hook assembly protein FlgD [Gammaproteobacteria bacterium]|nr:flagellar hook assembly protein FlgD [Gammaproteobacteria bacterium]
MAAVENNVQSRYAIQNTTPEKSKELGQEQFLELMTAQIKHQDPFEPMQNGEFIAQMANFASVESLSKMSENMASLVSALSTDQVLRAATLVGHEVLIPDSSMELGADGGARGAVMADFAGERIAVTVRDSSNQVINQFEVDANGVGSNMFEWDGTDRSGSRVAAGTYYFTAESGATGTTQAVQTAAPRRVTSVAPGVDGVAANLKLSGGGSTTLEQIIEIL